LGNQEKPVETKKNLWKQRKTCRNQEKPVEIPPKKTSEGAREKSIIDMNIDVDVTVIADIACT